MANCDNLFRHYNGVIKLSNENREILKGVRNNLRNRISKNYRSISNLELTDTKLQFQSQGSFVMDTIITPKDDDFDLDDGVYFLGNLTKEKRPPVASFHTWVMNSIGKDDNYGEVIDKDSCVRVRYKKEKFHIDLPIYYADNPDNPDLAHKTKDWSISNPLEFIDWFETKVDSKFNKSFLTESSLLDDFEKWSSDIRKTDAQLRRIVRYLKGWADNLRGEMPPGIIMTILAGENYVKDDRDDVSLNKTLNNIKSFLNANGCKCPRPTTPKNEDLFAEYSTTKKQYFIDRLNTFLESANQAISNPNQKEACLKWQKHLGERFPCSLAIDSMPDAKKYTSPAVLGDTTRSA